MQALDGWVERIFSAVHDREKLNKIMEYLEKYASYISCNGEDGVVLQDINGREFYGNSIEQCAENLITFYTVIEEEF